MICEKLEKCLDAQIHKELVCECVNKKDECIEVSDCQSNVKCEERGKKYVLENTQKNNVVLYKIDGGVVVQDKTVSQGICKCDYLFTINGTDKEAIVTELKGVDVAHSLKQIDGTLTLFKEFFSGFSHVYGRIIVGSSAPNIKASPNYVNLYKRLQNTYGGNLKIEKIQFTEKDVELAKV